MFIFRQDKQDYQDKNPVYLVNHVKKEKAAIKKVCSKNKVLHCNSIIYAMK